MTNTTKANNKLKESWFVVLLSNLSLKNQTKAQTANHVADGMATLLALAYIATSPPEYYSFSLIVIVLVFIFACFWVTKPASRRK